MLAALVLATALGASVEAAGGSVYEQDVASALDALGKQCKTLLDAKKIDWKAVVKEFAPAAKKVKTDSDELVILTRILARLEDGHAAVQPGPETKDVKWPEDGPFGIPGEPVGCGMFWCRIGKKIYVKNVWNAAAQVGLQAGSEILTVDGTPVVKWLDARIATLRDRISFSTDHQAFFYACHWGLAQPAGSRIELEVEQPDGKVKRRTISYSKGNPTPWGPAFFPKDLAETKDLNFGLLASGMGYVHIRRAKEDLPAQMDEALAKVGSAPGIVLDFRGNSGGSFDHEGFLGRFVPKGQTLAFGSRYESAGPNPYGGKVVVIVDATVRSAGETGAGIFKEDGRAYMIGESPTAGMSAQKTTIELPSKKFALYVAVSSNKQRFNGGKGIEGIGVVPHEIVEFDPEDLAAGVDTLIKKADEILAKFPAKKVPYTAP
jgi:C-terminal processing protease CtpA/Prc